MGNIKDKQTGAAVLPQFTVYIASDGQFGRILELVDGGDTWPDWCETVQTFAEVPLFVACLQIAGADIV